ncbi:transmembrane protein [Thalictrum thalictroides]|uniref:Transmembrane protein n=1 Tax=Thalictrum thalictroides TaxID=46969 RepID=A0A7J6VHZ5_THATH|nr:transmembrane protein [Thalictrum thalictroides]
MVVPGLLNNPTVLPHLNPSRPPLTPLSSFPYHYRYSKIYSLRSRRLVCNGTAKAKNTLQKKEEEEGGNDGLLRLILWATEGIYILWLFLLPYAPGDPVWAISSDTLNSIVVLSLNFFFVLPLMNFGNLIIVGIRSRSKVQTKEIGSINLHHGCCYKCGILDTLHGDSA